MSPVLNLWYFNVASKSNINVPNKSLVRKLKM